MKPSKDAHYYQHTYQLSAPHSETLALLPLLPTAEEVGGVPMLDLGCGRGRNALLLQDYGYTVEAKDQNAQALLMLQSIIEDEKLENITLEQYDLNTCGLPKNAYHTIVSTVVLMFLDPDKMEKIVRNIQDATQVGGFNLIVVAMDTEEYPCMMGFSSPFAEGQLQDYYEDWNIHTYNEDLGALHKVDADGKRIQLQFATIVAQKMEL